MFEIKFPFVSFGIVSWYKVREGRLSKKDADVKNPDGNISEVMLIVQVCSAGFDNEVINGELGKLADAFTTGAAANSPTLPLTVLVLQVWDLCLWFSIFKL